MIPVIESARRASERATIATYQQLSQGINSLAIVGSVAPLLGIVGTTLMMAVFPFGPSSFDRDARTFFTMRWLGDTLGPTSLGLAVGIAAILCHRYLTSRLEMLHYEMVRANESLTSDLVRYGGLLKSSTIIGHLDPMMFGAKSAEEIRRIQRAEHRSSLLTAALFLPAWLVQAEHYFSFHSLTLVESIQTSWISTAVALAISCGVAYPIWTFALNRKPGMLLTLASAFLVCWSLAVFALCRH